MKKHAPSTAGQSANGGGDQRFNSVMKVAQLRWHHPCSVGAHDIETSSGMWKPAAHRWIGCGCFVGTCACLWRRAAGRAFTIYVTDSATDLALNGPGFLPVRTGPAVRYVRGGRFTFDESGHLADDRGYVLQVAPVHATTYDVTGDVSASGDWASCESTKRVALEGNLNAEPPAVPAFDENQALTTSNFGTFVTVTGADRQRRQVDLFFRHQGEGVWSWFAIHNQSKRAPAVEASGTFRFIAGNMIEGQTAFGTFVFGDARQTIEINFGPTTAEGFHSKGMTTLPGPLVITRIESDGGCLVEDVKVSPAGLLSAHDISRLRKNIGHIPVVLFDHPEGLYEVEPGLYATTLASGPAHFGTAGTKGRGTLMSGVLESGVSACNQLRPGSSETLCGSAGEEDR